MKLIVAAIDTNYITYIVDDEGIEQSAGPRPQGAPPRPFGVPYLNIDFLQLVHE
jgi:hypothetical protein